MADIKVVELFAGVGGFRLGLERASEQFKTIFANQWEPSSKKQWAFDCYQSHFGDSKSHVCDDIAKIKGLIPSHDLLVGGFPCQDYSVARTNATGIEGKKGVLWWSILDVIHNKKPSFVLLENVDRLIKSPAKKRGRDFGIILKTLFDEGYAVEWRVINAADYGNVQRRRRILIFAYQNKTSLFKSLNDNYSKDLENWILNDGFLASAFPISSVNNEKKAFKLESDLFSKSELADISDTFAGVFRNSGVMINGKILSLEVNSKITQTKTLGDIVTNDEVGSKYYLTETKTEKFKYLKGNKKINRTKPVTKEPYVYSEGAMSFPDVLDKPSRTMLTSESSVNRSTHVIKDKTGKLRVLVPLECERLNGFDDNWTLTGMPESMRYFTMGNALVVPLIETIGRTFLKIWEKEKSNEGES